MIMTFNADLNYVTRQKSVAFQIHENTKKTVKTIFALRFLPVIA